MSLKTILSLVVIFAIGFWSAIGPRNGLTNHAADQAAGIATAAAGTYVSLRAANAVLSLVQEIEVGGSFVVSGSAQPFKVVEPLDDTIERISHVVFNVMVAAGVLAAAIAPLGNLGGGLMAIAAIALLAQALLPRTIFRGARLVGWYGGFLCLGLPVLLLGSSYFGDAVTAQTFSTHQSVVDDIIGSQRLEIAPDGVSSMRQNVEEYSAIARKAWARADELISAYLGLLAVFMLRVFVFPLLFLAGGWIVVRAIMRPSHPSFNDP
jgi:hypothetical protein